MAKSQNQKLKLLYLLKILNENSDEQHPISVQDMIRLLGRHDISAERKSIYDDLEALRTFGADVIMSRGTTTGYYIGARDFELAELKLLVDSVQSSKFITEKKTLTLIKKIENLASVHEGRQLQRQVYVRNRVKNMNESVYYNVDSISAAINNDRIIKFKYYEYTLSKEKQFRRNGDYYEVSPFALMWDDENYYMMAWDDAAGMMKHYRVDKMSGIDMTDAPRLGKQSFGAVDLSAYSKKVFGMFTGEEQQVRLKFKNHLIGAVIDRFGKDIIVVPAGEEHFTVTVSVAVSPQFYGWLFGYGDEVEILSPENVREQMRATAAAVADKHN